MYIEGLAEHGISCTTVRRLFKPPNKAVKNSLRYKGFVDAKVGGKKTTVEGTVILIATIFLPEINTGKN